MTNWKPVGPETLLNDGEMEEIKLEEHTILLTRVEGTYYAVQAFCSHMGGKFSGGQMEGFVVRCPRNHSCFDVRDGSVQVWLGRMPGIVRKVAQGVMPPKPLRTYPTRIHEGQVWVALEA